MTKHDGLILNIHHFTHVRDAYGTPAEVTWGELRATEHDVRGEAADTDNAAALNLAKDADCIMLGSLKPGRARGKRNIEASCAVGLDLDADNVGQIATALEVLREYEMWAYSTHKHLSGAVQGAPRIRIILPLSRSVSPVEAESTFRVLARMVGSPPVDMSACDASRLHYLPSTYDARVAWSLHNPGALLVPVKNSPRTSVPHQSAASVLAALNKVRAWLLRIGKEHPLKNAATRLLAGKALAKQGGRHTAIRELTWAMAMRYRDEIGEEHIRALFAPSLSKMESTAEKVWEAYEGALNRLEEDDREKEEQRRADIQRQQARRIGRQPYTDGELGHIANRLSCSVEDLEMQWVIQRDNGYFFLDENGDYRGPYRKDDAKVAIHHVLAPSPVTLINVGQRGGVTYRPVSDIAIEHGEVCDGAVADMAIQRHAYDRQTKTMHMATTPLRTFAPQRHQDIEDWLGVLAGSDKSKLLDWMAVAPDLDKLLCAIYFGGHPGGGKSLFAHGMAKLWTNGGPSALDRVLGNFNGDLTRCPLVFADEKTTNNQWHRATITQDLREMISIQSRPLRKLYAESMSLNGCIRVLLAANNPFLLKMEEVATSRDLEAIAERFLYIEVGKNAKEFMDNVTQSRVKYWLNQGIAEHALWLRDNREVAPPEHRFWVEGSIDKMHHILLASSKWNALACEWLVRFCANTVPGTNLTKSQLIVVDNDTQQLLVNAQAIIDGWRTYLPNKQRTDPDTSAINAALRAMSRGSVTRTDGKTQVYFDIDFDILSTWAEVNHMQDPASLFS